MKPILTPFTGRQLTRMLDSLTPEQLDMPLWVHIGQHILTQQPEIDIIGCKNQSVYINKMGATVVTAESVKQRSIEYYLCADELDGRN
jgi:hypothetical protein